MGVFHRVTVPLVLHDLDQYAQQVHDIHDPETKEKCRKVLEALIAAFPESATQKESQ